MGDAGDVEGDNFNFNFNKYFKKCVIFYVCMCVEPNANFTNDWRGYKYNMLTEFPIRIWILLGPWMGVRIQGQDCPPNKKKLHVLKS